MMDVTYKIKKDKTKRLKLVLFIHPGYEDYIHHPVYMYTILYGKPSMQLSNGNRAYNHYLHNLIKYS